ncbi:hypothetical protein BJV82DRAFT_499842, partial [Fennellomyces sp. T-0311]
LTIQTEWASRDGRLLVARVSHHQQLCSDLFLYVLYAPAQEAERHSLLASDDFANLLDLENVPQRRCVFLGDFNHNIYTAQAPQRYELGINRWLYWIRHHWTDHHNTSTLVPLTPTYHNRAQSQTSTIDFLLLTDDLANEACHAQWHHVPRCDHVALSISLSLGFPKPGPGIWR